MKKKLPTKEEIEYKLMQIFNRAEVKRDIKAATKYIFSIINKCNVMPRQLKIWNGRGCGDGEFQNGHLYVAAYSVKEAVNIINTTLNAMITVYEIKNYYADCWGDTMKNITPKKPCLYATKKHFGKPIKLF
jgi:hypothetical protein